MQLSIPLLSLIFSVLRVANGEFTPLAHGFRDSCQGIHLLGSGQDVVLAATCENNGGGDNGEVTLPLSLCLINVDGVLLCHSGGILALCDDCFLTSITVLSCTCMRNNGGTEFSTIDLNNCVGNNNGNLVC